MSTQQTLAVLSENPETASALQSMSREHEWSNSDLLLWLTAPTTRLSGARPVDVLASNPAAVIDAAQFSMSEEW